MRSAGIDVKAVRSVRVKKIFFKKVRDIGAACES